MSALHRLMTQFSLRRPASSPAQAIVVRRGFHPDFYRFMHIAASANGMALIIDARVEERRQAVSASIERRVRNRRCPLPVTWASEGCFVASISMPEAPTQRTAR